MAVGKRCCDHVLLLTGSLGQSLYGPFAFYFSGTHHDRHVWQFDIYGRLNRLGHLPLCKHDNTPYFSVEFRVIVYYNLLYIVHDFEKILVQVWLNFKTSLLFRWAPFLHVIEPSIALCAFRWGVLSPVHRNVVLKSILTATKHVVGYTTYCYGWSSAPE